MDDGPFTDLVLFAMYQTWHRHTLICVEAVMQGRHSMTGSCRLTRSITFTHSRYCSKPVSFEAAIVR